MNRRIEIWVGSPRRKYASMILLIAVFPLLASGCIFADCSITLRVRGQVVNAESGTPIGNAAVRGRTFTDGAETGLMVTYLPVSNADGSFDLKFTLGLSGCPPPAYPPPDQMEIIILRDGCEQRFMIEINEDSTQYVEVEFSGDEVLELRDPILVPPCEPAP